MTYTIDTANTLPQFKNIKTMEDVENYIKGCFKALGLNNWTFSWSNRFANILGECHPWKHLIKFNYRFVDSYLSINAKEIQIVILHELAHAIDYVQHGYSSGHGYNWKKCCRFLGIDGEKARNKTVSLKNILKKSNKPLFEVYNIENGIVYCVRARKPRKMVFGLNPSRYVAGRKQETIGKLALRKVCA